jgi:hypothetical protein
MDCDEMQVFNAGMQVACGKCQTTDTSCHKKRTLERPFLVCRVDETMPQ